MQKSYNRLLKNSRWPQADGSYVLLGQRLLNPCYFLVSFCGLLGTGFAGAGFAGVGLGEAGLFTEGLFLFSGLLLTTGLLLTAGLSGLFVPDLGFTTLGGFARGSFCSLVSSSLFLS